MTCSCCSDYGTIAGSYFGAKQAEGDMKRFRKKGPNPTTRILKEFLQGEGGGTALLDIGGGIGALSFLLLRSGFERATLVDASREYVAVARREAEEQNAAHALTAVEGDFAVVGDSLDTADAVAMDRVICCYPDFRRLLKASLRHAGRLFAFSYPRDRWYIRWGIGLENVLRSIRGRTPFRVFVHSESAMREVIECEGFRRVRTGGTFSWAVEAYVRKDASNESRKRMPP